MPLQVGNWKMNANGQEFTLEIIRVQANGELNGRIDAAYIKGFWDETSRKVYFGVLEPMAPFFTVEDGLPTYEGVVFSTPTTPTPGTDVTWTMVGTFKSTSLIFLNEQRGNTRRNEFGWFAQITEVV